MGIEILDCKNNGFDILLFFILIATVQSESNSVKIKTGPKREVISIYNDNFKTPKNRPPYFIEVYRCVAIDNEEDEADCGSDTYPIPFAWTNITIVVKDLGDETKFYEYTIYNHTSCACGADSAKSERKHIERLVTIVTFKAEKENNPVNLLDRCDFCDNPQPRFYKYNKKPDVIPKYKYHAYNECLPGCIGSLIIETIKVNLVNRLTALPINLKSYLSCKPYDGSNKRQIQGNPLGKGLAKEVVSVYNENFTTPPGRFEYFIEVQRCVQAYKDNLDKVDPDCLTIPKHFENITIVVPDVTNETIFYKYVVYNHTSCGCGDSDQWKLRDDKEERVSREDFLKEYENNPVNLRRPCDFCKEPYPRYMRHPKDILKVSPEYRYLLSNQCLPGCDPKSKKIPRKTYLHNAERSEFIVSVLNHSRCLSITKPSNMTNSKKVGEERGSSKHSGKSFDKEQSYELLLYVGSGKLMLVAFLLALVLLTILIADFTLCRTEKGFFYALCSCKNVNVLDTECERCTHRHLNEITV